MTIYYTAKDIEEMAAQGISRLEIGPGITLTDFARETARQLDITLVKSGQKPAPGTAAPAGRTNAPSKPAKVSDKYNKPSGCQHGPGFPPAGRSQAAPSQAASLGSGDSTTVNRLIDLMGKVIKKG